MSGNTLPLAPDARSLGKYEVLCRLSTGGMAEIFLASQRGLAGFRKLVVLKQILPDIRGEEEFVRMFLDEAKVTAAFNHPHIAQVYDLDIADGELFLSMEFVPGATLVEVARACRQANHPIPLGYSLMAVRDTAVALHYAHTFTDPLGRPSPVIHRDVAEKNIMVTYEGVTKLLDFGIAKSLARASRTAVGMVKGTSGYMSPEQIMGEPLDARSDLFSLGVVLHECLTGMRLFYAKQAEAMMNAVLKCEVTPPSRTNKQVPPELDAIVMRALSKKRGDRYATTLEFARALERAVGPLIWHPEQSSELMLRLFSDRREQTRQLLMAGQAITADATGELNLAKVLAMGSESELPTGAASVPAPVPQRPSVAVPTVKGSAQAKPATPAQGAPAVRRPTVSAPTLPPPPAEVGTVRKASSPAAQKRAAARTMSGEVARPTPPPSESVAPPVHEQSGARTQPGRPALMPEHTVRAQQITAPHPAAEDNSSRPAQRGGVAPEPSTLQDEPVRAPRGPRNTQDGLRAVAPPEASARGAEEPARARSGRGTLDNLRITPALTPPSPERDAQTAMVRPGAAGDERDLQTAMVRPPAAPMERDAQTAMVRPPTAPMERDLQTAMVRPPTAPVERDLQKAMVRPPAPPSEREAQTPSRPPAPPLEREALTPSRQAASEREAQAAARQTPSEREGQAQSRQPHAEREAPAPARQPHAEREVQTASRPPPPPSEREAQAASRPPPPPPPPEREAQAAMSRAGHQAEPSAVSRPQSSAEREGHRARALPERPEETVSITPTNTPRRIKSSRRRQPPPPPSFPEPEVRTEAVRALKSDRDVFPRDVEGAAFDDEDAHENTQSGMRVRHERRGGAWMALVVVLLLLGGGAVTVILGLDGGRVSAWVKPMLGLEPKQGTPPPPPTTAQGNTPAKPPVAVGANAPTTAPDTGTTPPVQGSSPAPVANANSGPDAVDSVTAVDTAEATPDAETKPAEPPTVAQDDGPPPEDSPTPRKPTRGPKRTRDTTPRKPEAGTGTNAPAASTDSDSAQAAEPGFLTLVTEPYAKVFLGSSELGDTPLFKVKLPSGKQILKLVDGNGKALKLPVEIKPGETTAVRIPLEMLSRQ
ncbi:serine/threonine-protein kinase [Pyxidicoccus sp. MSG2]|uniref:serine/threonine-protein kinase n=1 Tax=Pyxidicoccus sp. MSG2 TaxID=2996790 RepID=UPI0022703EAD|nr:serine/threonine protein kinase [Pyxidicoccus sp. MSG2]MCY1018134.1 protein kinase [Pyxidicoccus sp. MSG2]